MKDVHIIAPVVQSFFHNYMAAQRGLSSNTILSYKDGIKLLLCFASQRVRKPVDKLTIEHFDEELVVAFQNYLEDDRGNSVRTRNVRLGAIHTFFRYVAGQDPTVLARCQQICAIPVKRHQHKTIEYLEDEEIRAILQSIDLNARNGVRDNALLLLLYNTGARVQEVVDLKVDDLRLESPTQVKLMGKGRKQRACPLWPETVEALQNYLQQRDSRGIKLANLFLNANGQPITRFGIRYIVRRYTAKASEVCASLKHKNIGPHSVRHTTAMSLLQSGNDIYVIKDWLGHAHVKTTHGYVEIDMKMKRKALDACQPPASKTFANKRHKWLKPGILQWLDDLSKQAAIMCSQAYVAGTASASQPYG